MLHFTRDYYIYNNELYRKIKPHYGRYFLTTKEGKRKWITLTQILDIIKGK